MSVSLPVGDKVSGDQRPPFIRQTVKQLRREVKTGSYKPKDNDQLQRHLADKITAVRRITRL